MTQDTQDRSKRVLAALIREYISTGEPVASSLSAGATVTQGQPVATVAGTPGHCAPATCLHWGVLRGDVYLDPLALVGAVRVVLLPLRPP